MTSRFNVYYRVVQVKHFFFSLSNIYYRSVECSLFTLSGCCAASSSICLLHIFRRPLTSIFHALVTTSSSVFLSTYTNHLSLQCSPALVLIFPNLFVHVISKISYLLSSKSSSAFLRVQSSGLVKVKRAYDKRCYRYPLQTRIHSYSLTVHA